MFSHYLNRISGLTSLFVLVLFMTSNVHSAPGNIADSPLFANSNVPPNVFFEVDDSGSMDWEVLTKPHWHYCAYDNNAVGNTGSSDCGYYIEDGLSSITTDSSAFQLWLEEVMYLFDDSDSLYNSYYCRSRIEYCDDQYQLLDWRLYSSDLNTQYYDPDVNYSPWQGGSFSDASFTSVRSDPKAGSDGYSSTRNLKNGISDGTDTGFIYEVWEDSHGFSNTRPNRGWNADRTVGSNGLVDLWDNHTRYYVKENSIVAQKVTYTISSGNLTENIATTTYSGSDTINGKTIAEIQQNIANWYQYYRRRSFVVKAAIGEVISANPENRYGLNFINNISFPYNGGSSDFIEVPTGTSGFSSHNSSLLDGLFSLNWPANGTPLRQGLERVGQYFDHNSLSKSNDPIQYECQQNFALLLTDGYWNGDDPSATIGNADGDGYSISVADIAKYYYDKDLSTKTDAVPDSSFDSATYQHLVTYTVAFGVSGLLNDYNNNGWPDVSNTDSTNLAENANWGDPFVVDSPQKIDDLWHAAYNSKGSFVSASTPAEVSSALSDAIGSVGNRLGSAASVSFSTTSLSSDTNVFLAQFNKDGNKWSGDLLSLDLDADGVFVTTTETDTNGDTRQVIVPAWSAGEMLDNRTNPVTTRTIITYDKTLDIAGNIGNGIPFQWANLTTEQKNDFRTEPNGTLTGDDVKAEARLTYLRGDQTYEALAGGTYTFRDRSSLLGDIINSSPAFVKLPRNNWPKGSPFPSTTGNAYSDFQADQASRNGVVYVGANDGMLHAFSEATGEELLAYVPSFLFSSASANEGLHFLTDPTYEHSYYVDSGAKISDVYMDTADGQGIDWHTVLLGATRSGGRGIFALDITDPSLFSEANAAKLALWEFSSADDPDLGLTFSQPIVAMMNNDRWAAIFGNGYNNTGDGKGKLFIVFLDGGLDGVWTAGTDYIELDTAVGSITNSDCLDSNSDCNGLSSPHAVDLDGDQVVDRVYAGDIQGNLWAFDVSNSVETNWNVAYKANDNVTPKPLFIASSSQPITGKPTVVRHPDVKKTNTNDPNVLVFFGTGQYLTDDDVNAVPATQSFYGVWDHGTGQITANDLFEQRFDTTTTFLDNETCDPDDNTCTDADNDLTDSIRVFLEYDDDGDGYTDTINYDDPTKTLHEGWKIDFDVASIPGERVIVDSVTSAGLVFFNTIVPDASPCNSGGSSYLFSVEQLHGGAPDINDPAFDLNGDGVIDSSDLVKSTNGTDAPVGTKFSYGLAANSKIISNDKTSRQFTPGSDRSGDGGDGSGTDNRVVRNRGGSGPGSLPFGRISWQELR